MVFGIGLGMAVLWKSRERLFCNKRKRRNVKVSIMKTERPRQQGFYRQEFEHGSCGIGFVAHLKGKKSHSIIRQGLDILTNMTHRGAE